MSPMTKLEIPSPGRVLIADDDTSARTALVALGRERAGHFSWDEATERLIDLYRRVVHSGR